MKKIALASLVLFTGIGFYATDAQASACGPKGTSVSTHADSSKSKESTASTSRRSTDNPADLRSGNKKAD
jgi:predicted nucleic acid-binding Zn ribbon protein